MRASLTDDNAAYVNSDKQNVQIIFETHSSYTNFGRHYLEVWTTVNA